MVLVKCFECETLISVNADRCPKCGTMDTPMARRSAEIIAKNKELTVTEFVVIFLIWLFSGWFFGFFQVCLFPYVGIFLIWLFLYLRGYLV